MAALLVTLNIMAILLAVAMPVWKTTVKREKEAELIFRGGQYARAVDLFRRKYANAYPPNIDILLNERFLRKKYKDPMTKDGEFRLLYAADQPAAQVPGANVPGGSVPGAVTPGAVRPGTPAPATTTPLDQPTQGPAGARGGIMGVSSTSSESSLKLFNGRGKYNEWAFTPQTVLGIRAAGQGQPGPGANRPGVGPGGPGGSQRPGAPGTGFPPRPGQPGQPSTPRPPFGTRPPGDF